MEGGAKERCAGLRCAKIKTVVLCECLELG